MVPSEANSTLVNGNSVKKKGKNKDILSTWYSTKMENFHKKRIILQNHKRRISCTSDLGFAVPIHYPVHVYIGRYFQCIFWALVLSITVWTRGWENPVPVFQLPGKDTFFKLDFLKWNRNSFQHTEGPQFDFGWKQKSFDIYFFEVM